MAIGVKLDDLLHDRRVTLANLSILTTGEARAIRFSALDAICEALSCQPGDIPVRACTRSARAIGSGDFTQRKRCHLVATSWVGPAGVTVTPAGASMRNGSPLMHWAQIVVECHLPDLAAKLESLDSGVAKMEPDVDSRVGVLFRGLREAGE